MSTTEMGGIEGICIVVLNVVVDGIDELERYIIAFTPA
jgi:hypothetical protein